MAADFIQSRLNASNKLNNWAELKPLFYLQNINIFCKRSFYACRVSAKIYNFENLIDRGRRFPGKNKSFNTTLK